MKVIIDSGHGGTETGASSFGMAEKDLNLVFSRLVASKLEEQKISVIRSLINDNYYESRQLTDKIKDSGADLCISCHNNSYNGTARGFEVIHSIHSDGRLANIILDEVKKTGFPVRRAYSRQSTSTSHRGQDYYYIIRLTYPKVETIIVEFGFMDNAEDFRLLNDPVWQNKLASAVASGIKSYIAGQKNLKTPILGSPTLAKNQLKRALSSINANAKASLIDLYHELSTIYGIKYDLAFLQAVHETNWFKFTGVVKAQQNNFAGLGATGPSNPGESFPIPDVGIEAHLQHLYAYASKSPLPANRPLHDTRFNLVQRGIAPNWEDLNGRWAVPGIGYGENIVKLQKTILLSYPDDKPEDDGSDVKDNPKDPVPPVHWAKIHNDELVNSGILSNDHSSNLDNYATEGMVVTVVNKLRRELTKNE